MNKKTLIADTHDIFYAFIINGLHHNYCIYCQLIYSINITTVNILILNLMMVTDSKNKKALT